MEQEKETEILETFYGLEDRAVPPIEQDRYISIEKAKEIINYEINRQQHHLEAEIKMLKTNSSKKMKFKTQIEILSLMKVLLNDALNK